MATPNELAPATPAPLVHPWLVAGWPGIGGVAAISATYLVSSLDAKPMGMIPEREFFSVNHVEVQGGIARSGRLPRNMFFVWRDPEGKRDLIIFVGEAQPSENGYQLCRRIIDVAQTHGVERVVTFAAMASALRPDSEPRVYGAVTAPDMLEPVREQGIELLRQGQIGGLNGALLAAAAERDMPAMCLLGEMPFFAAGAPNPRAASAALGAFSRLSGVKVDMAALEHQSAQMQVQLEQLFEQLQRHQALLQAQSEAASGDEVEEDADEAENGIHEDQADEESAAERADDAASDASPADSTEGGPTAAPATPERRSADDATRRHIEDLFARAADDRDAAFALKAELDRLGLFEAYENRFLDLFRKAE